MERIGMLSKETMRLGLDGEAITDRDERLRASEDCAQLAFAVSQVSKQLLKQP